MSIQYFLLNCARKFNLNIFIMKKEIVKIIIKVLIYALGLIGAYFGITSMTSCSAQRSVITRGNGTVISCDTIYIDHNGNYQLKVR